MVIINIFKIVEKFILKIYFLKLFLVKQEVDFLLDFFTFEIIVNFF